MRRRRAWAALAAAAFALAACKGVQTTLDPAADQAAKIDDVWRAMLVVCGVMYVLVMAFLVWALWRTRRRAIPAEPAAGPTAAEPLLERGLAGWAGLIVAGLIVLVTVSFLVDRSLAETGPQPLRIKVTAHQWWWEVEYEGETPDKAVTTANEIRLPLGRPAVIALQAGDVIHSFWAPNLAGKMDLIPGRTNYLAVTPRRLGPFRGQCAEFCGLEHAKMAFDVRVQTPADFEAWRVAQRSEAVPPLTPAAQRGRQVFEARACVMCHRVQGSGASATAGPDLTHLMSREHIGAGALPNTRGDLAAWIADPQGIKPGTTMPRVALATRELDDLLAYLESLK